MRHAVLSTAPFFVPAFVVGACAPQGAPRTVAPPASAARSARESQSEASASRPLPEARARALVEALVTGDVAHRNVPFTPQLAERLSPEQLRAAWSKQASALGAFRGIDGVLRDHEKERELVFVDASFEHGACAFRVVLDARGDVDGFWLEGGSPLLLRARSRALFEALAAGRGVEAERHFATSVRDKVHGKLDATWKELIAQKGAFGGVTDIDGRDGEVTVTMSLGDRASAMRVYFDGEGFVTGFFVTNPWTAPPYSDASRFYQEPVNVGIAPALPGMLALPNSPGRHPAVVLVHGSGPADADESVGQVKVFKDLAFGLASRGIVVLRYVKRSRHSPAGIVTQKEEVLDAARDAVDLLAHRPEVDATRLFVVGHSQGGALAPRIARDDPRVAGIVLLAGAAQPLQDHAVAQLKYFLELSPNDGDLRRKVDAAIAFKRRVDDPALAPDADVAFPFGGTAKGAYYLDARANPPTDIARGLKIPVLVLQGNRDYQVTTIDFELWKRALKDNPRASFQLYPSLNHLFVAGEGKPSPAEYERPGHVAEKVVEDVASWVSRPLSVGR